MNKTELGRIQKVSFGEGGYQEAMIGISFTLGGNGWGVGDFWGDWSCDRTANTGWSEGDRIDNLGAMVMRVHGLLKQAKKHYVPDLVGVPVEATFDGNRLVSWRVLTEVL